MQCISAAYEKSRPETERLSYLLVMYPMPTRKACIRRRTLDRAEKGAMPPYLAYSVERVSRITFTRI